MTYRARNIAVAVVLAIVAALLTGFYVTSYKQNVQHAEANVSVLVATKDIPQGTSGADVIAKKFLAPQQVLRRSVVPGALSDTKQIEDLIATQPIYAGEQVSARRFQPVTQSGVRSELKGNMRALQIEGDANQLLAGTLRPHDRVDVVANIKYKLMDRFTDLPFVLNVVVCALVGLLWARLVWVIRSDRNDMRHWLGAGVGVLAWTLLCRLFFEFESGKILGCLSAGLFLVGAFELFRRARLPVSWSALVGVLVLFATFHFVMNGFALSHVDFRFAGNKIIPFEQEIWRAPQQIAWTVVKYLAILLPVLTVLFLAPARLALAEQILQMGWWRQLLIVVSALGLSLFDARGVNELCSEEIYFWTFLNLVLFLFCLTRLSVGRQRIVAHQAHG